jgi:uncharacterized membrane protein YphA (DoxX/SURF4 family)
MKANTVGTKASGHLITFIFLVGRLVAGGMYFMAGAQNLLQLDAKAGYAASKGVSNPTFWVVAASVLLLIGGFSIAVGIRPYLGVTAIALFLVPVTVIMHNFWTLTGLQAELEFHSFMGNAGLLGSAFLFVAIPQPWAISLDGWIRSRLSMFSGLSTEVSTPQKSAVDA